VALTNGLVLVSNNHWAAAIREADGTISVASGKKPRLPGTGDPGRAGSDREGSDRGGSDGIPVLRGLGRFAESLLVLGLVKKHLPHARLPIEGARVAAALAASFAAGTAVRALTPGSPVAQEAGTALAGLIPAVLVVRNSSVAGYHGAEHKVIGAREEALRAAARAKAEEGGSGGGSSGGTGVLAVGGASRARGAAGSAPGTGRTGQSRGISVDEAATLTGDAAAAAKEHDRCGSNLIGPFLFATVLANLLARGRSGRRTPLRSAVAGAASLGIALEGMRWATAHPRSPLARAMMLPGRALQKSLTTSEPSAEQLEVGERALAELLRLERAAV
jgi:hypothetical protein